VRPDKKAGRPGIYEGFAPDGDPVLLKTWPRASKADDRDIEAVWSHEMRQLHRLAGYPGADDLLPYLIDTGSDASGFHLVLAPGQRRPLATLLEHGTPSHWLRQPRLVANRLRIWMNLRRLATALEMLHAQGLLHRNLDSWAVLAAGGDEPDFQLTGFEWSMRIVGPAEQSQRRRRGQAVEVNSFDQDWLLYGLLAGQLLDAKPERLTSFGLSASDVAEHLTAAEVRLLRNIIGVDKLDRLDGDVVVTRIDEVMSGLAAEASGRDAKLHLAFNLGPRSTLSAAIRKASANEIELHDVESQAGFVEADLAQTPLLQAVQLQGQSTTRLLLQGHQLSYWVGQYRHPRANAAASWEFAFTDSVATRLPAPSSVKAKLSLEASSLQLLTGAEAAEKYPRMRGRVRTWDEIQKSFDAAIKEPSPEDTLHRALALTLFLDALFSAADVFPVEIVSAPELPEADGVMLQLRPRLDEDREELAKALGLRSCAARLRDALVGDGIRRQEWTLTDAQTLGERKQTDSEWRFERSDGGQKEAQTYQFRGTSPPPLIRLAVLIPSDSVGRDVQFRRQLKALAALKEHRELLEMLTDPRRRILDTHERIRADEDLTALDDAKRQALVEIFETLPLYLVQGPPGVGKTRLVRELVKRRIRKEPTSRLLLAAQSNAAIDHLLEEVAPTLSATDEEPLIVRCKTPESAEEPSLYEVSMVARDILAEFIGSDLAKRAPVKLQRALRELASSAGPKRRGPREKFVKGYDSTAYATRAFEGVILRSANLVFATTNSAELERLIEERGQFDWSIVEEAGKATGAELLTPQLLSHRRLMIGDHKQLPAFGADQMRRLLEVPENVRMALDVGQDFIGRSLRGEATEEILDDLDEEGLNLPALCGRAIDLVTLFQTLLEAEFERQIRKPQGKRIAKRLNLQHRMHPAIAEIVSHCFYEDGQGDALKTHPDALARFRDGAPPFASSAPDRLPVAPVVVVEMPSIQGTPHLKKQERFPRWTNPSEVDAVTAALSLLEAGADQPTLAVLSPYSQQVNLLSHRIADQRAGNLSNLNRFRSAAPSGEFVHTVDSFQGSEADVVVVSLVRNNDHSGLRNALGFLADPRRMNVLLSRARWQLILVGSPQFLGEVVDVAKAGDEAKEVEFLARLLASLERGRETKSVAWVPVARLLGDAS
jgi:hypothetical protein